MTYLIFLIARWFGINLMPVKGCEVWVVFLGGCMDTEVRRVRATVTEREASFLIKHWLPLADEQTYIYRFLTVENELIRGHSSDFYFNRKIDQWEFRT